MRRAKILAAYTLWFCSASALAQTNRQIEVRVLDSIGRPIAAANVAVRPTYSSNPFEEIVPDEPKPVPEPIAQATTDSAGVATISLNEKVKEDEAVIVTAWLAGYGPSTTTVMKTAELRCSPSRQRTIQVVDDSGKPVQGLSVRRDSGTVNESEYFKPPWWSSTSATTDELGIATIEVPASARNFIITDKNGTQHRFAHNDLGMRMLGRATDDRELMTVRLARYGSLKGKMSAEFAQDYKVRMDRLVNNLQRRMAEHLTTVSSEPQMEPDGTFQFPALDEGDYRLIVYRKNVYNAATDPPLAQQPVHVQNVTIQAGQVAQVTVGVQSATKVAGRLVATDEADLSSASIVFGQGTSSQTLVRSACAADGSFVVWLPPGKYRPTLSGLKGWRVGMQPEFDVGVGAASLTLNPVTLTATNSRKVIYPDRQPHMSLLTGSSYTRLSFLLKDESKVECTLTADGFGRIAIPVGAEVVHIGQDFALTGQASVSAFVDRDESEDFELELIKTAQGRGTNVAISGRVVNAQGQPVAGAQVNVAMNYETVPGSNGVRMSIGNFGSQFIDSVVTQQDGSYSIPPRQLLQRLTFPKSEAESECRFVFTVSTQANPEPIEVRQIVQAKPSQWSLTNVELPDLVIERSLEGQRFSGKLLNEQGEPSAGEVIRLGDKRRLVRRLTDREGNFAFEQVAGPTWLLRERDWSIRAIDNYDQPLTLPPETSDTLKSANQAAPWQRLDKPQRLALAKEVLKKIPSPSRSGLPDEAYVDRESYFSNTLLGGGASLDDARIQYVSFWMDLSDEQLEQLVAAATKSFHKSVLLRLLADRHPSAAAYERVMNAIEVPSTQEVFLDRLLAHVAEVALKLNSLGTLEPHRFKLQRIMEIWTELRNKREAQLKAIPNNLQAAFMDSDAALICRALLNLDEFSESIAEQLSVDASELTVEDRSIQLRNMSTFLRIFPSEQFKLPGDRIMISPQAWLDIGAQDPLVAVEAARQGKLPKDGLRLVLQSALESHHSDAEQAFTESLPILVREDPYTSRLATSSLSLPRPLEVSWYQAARQFSRDLGRQAAWFLAYDYLNGKYEDSMSTIIPTMERRSPSMLAIAYSLVDEHPALAKQIIDRAVPRLLNQIETDFELPYSRTRDISLVAYVAPNETTQLLIKLQERLDAEQKKQAGANSMVYSMRNSMSALKVTCLRGLLIEKF